MAGRGLRSRGARRHATRGQRDAHRRQPPCLCVVTGPGVAERVERNGTRRRGHRAATRFGAAQRMAWLLVRTLPLSRRGERRVVLERFRSAPHLHRLWTLPGVIADERWREDAIRQQLSYCRLFRGATEWIVCWRPSQYSS